MGQALRILLIEDSEDDAELLLRELRRAGYVPSAKRVASAAEVTTALDSESWDLIISDYVMPGFDGLEALALYRERRLDVPFIVVSGHIGEEIAVSAMQAGADDYLMKDRMARLVPAVARALQKAEMRRAHFLAAEALRESEERFRQLAENIGAVFFMFEKPTAQSPGALSYVSPAFQTIWGFPCESLIGSSDLWWKSVHAEDRARIESKLGQLGQGRFSEEFRVVRMDLKLRWVQFRTFPVRNLAGEVYRIAAIAEDITERKRSEEQLAGKSRELENTVTELQIMQEQLRCSNDELSRAHQELERRVQQRTAALATANSELKNQMAERKRLEAELLEIAENERRRIGFDLHDDLGQKLLGVSLLLKAQETTLRNKGMAEASVIGEVLTLLQQVISHTHNLAHCFSGFGTENSDLTRQLHKLAVNVGETFQISCRFRSIGTIPALSADATAQMYKIAQESVSNAIKHGKAKRVSVVLARKEAQVFLRIKNDGIPYETGREPSNRLGMRIMKYRANIIGGELEIKPNGNSGTLVTCTLPCANGAKATAARPPKKPSSVSARKPKEEQVAVASC
jgi:two-component system sensor histidine kinase UhpB